MREKLYLWLRWINQNWLAALVVLAAGLLILTLFIRAVLPRPPIRLLSFTPTAEKKLFPLDAVRLNFDSDPNLYGCQVSSGDQEIITERTSENIISVTPKTYWPLETKVELQITCERYERKLNWSTASFDDLSPEQALGLQSQLDVKFSRTVEKFYQDNPFAQAFPLKRESYTLYYHDDINKIVIGTNRVFSLSEKQKIIQTERELLKTVGVPAEIEIVFASDLP